MHFDHVSIVSVGAIDAPIEVASSEIETRLKPVLERLNIRPGLLENLAGIRARRYWEEGVEPSDVATQAARKALDLAGVDPQRIGVVINTSVCRDYIEPSTACLVHGNLGLAPECMNFDLGNACLAFMNGMQMAGNMIERGQIHYALIVDGEGSRNVCEKTIERLLDSDCDEEAFRSSFAALTLGSGAVAMVLARKELAPEGHRFVGAVELAATQHNLLCRGQPDWMETDTKRLLMGGLELASQTWVKAQKELGWKQEELDHFVLHQVSKVHTESLAQTLGLEADKIFTIFNEFGNIGPAAVPITLAKSLEQGRIKRGDRIALMGIGSGLNCAMAEIAW